jgi:hypothetical protein
VANHAPVLKIPTGFLAAPQARMKIARSFNCGFDVIKIPAAPEGRQDFPRRFFSAATLGLDGLDGFYPQLKLRAILGCPFGTRPAAAGLKELAWQNLCEMV